MFCLKDKHIVLNDLRQFFLLKIRKSFGKDEKCLLKLKELFSKSKIKICQQCKFISRVSKKLLFLGKNEQKLLWKSPRIFTKNLLKKSGQ